MQLSGDHVLSLMIGQIDVKSIVIGHNFHFRFVILRDLKDTEEKAKQLTDSPQESPTRKLWLILNTRAYHTLLQISQMCMKLEICLNLIKISMMLGSNKILLLKL